MAIRVHETDCLFNGGRSSVCVPYLFLSRPSYLPRVRGLLFRYFSQIRPSLSGTSNVSTDCLQEEHLGISFTVFAELVNITLVAAGSWRWDKVATYPT
jgi:hypothetical protein